MGRDRTGITTKEVKRIELSYLLKNKFIEKGEIKFFTLKWTDNSSISVCSNYTENDRFLELDYTSTNSWSGETKKCNYKIELDFIPSNLGIGEVPFFLCPKTGNRCRILYKAYGSRIWKSRDAYTKTIFYESQTGSRYSKYNDEYWRLEKEIERLRTQKRWQTHYNGKETRRFKRYKKLADRQRKVDTLRFHPDYIPKSIRGFIF